MSGWVSTLAALLVLAPVPGAAQERGPTQSAQQAQGAFERYGGVPDHINLKAGLFLTTHGTITRFDSDQLGVGTLVDLEFDLGLAQSTTNLRADGYIRLGRRHRLGAGYLRLDRSGNQDLQRTIQWGDEVFDLDVNIESFWQLKLVPAHYRFALIKSDRVDLGLSAGVFALFLDAGLSAPEASIREPESISFPLPVLGVDLEVAPAKRLYAQAGFEYFGLKIQDVDGSWFELRGGIEYFPLRHIGVGAAYRWVDISVDTLGDIDSGAGLVEADLFIDYDFRGPQLYVALAF
jgi:hypothetical protein